MKKLLLLAFLIAGIALFPSTDLFAQDTLRVDTLWYDDFDDGDCTSNYQWIPVDWYGITTIDCATGQMVVSTSVPGTGVIAYSFGNLYTDCGDYTISCKAMFSGVTGYEDFEIFAKMDQSYTKQYVVKFIAGGIWLFEAMSVSWLDYAAAPEVRVDTMFNAKVTVAGDVILAKAWDPDSTEPPWQLTYTQATIPGGYKDLWNGVQVGGYWIDSITVDDFVVYGPPYCDWASGDINADYLIDLVDVINLARYIFGQPGYDPIECPNGR